MSPASLPDVLDQQRDEERRRCVRALLRHPLLTPGGPDQQAFVLARRHAGWLGDWFANQAGWTFHADHAAVRLMKIPGELSDASRGAAAKVPFGRRKYVLTCLALAALERAENWCQNTPVAQFTGLGVEQVVECSLSFRALPCSANDGPPTTMALAGSASSREKYAVPPGGMPPAKFTTPPVVSGVISLKLTPGPS